MYWSDWGAKPVIGRLGMDGSLPTDFISDNIHWPNSLAIDHGNQRLYWVDAKLLKIESIKLDGTDRRVCVIVISIIYRFNFFHLYLYNANMLNLLDRNSSGILKSVRLEKQCKN